jgi:hypothetical protein
MLTQYCEDSSSKEDKPIMLKGLQKLDKEYFNLSKDVDPYKCLWFLVEQVLEETDEKAIDISIAQLRNNYEPVS